MHRWHDKSTHSEHLYHLIPKMVDHLDGNAAGWFVEGAGDVAVEGCPGLLVGVVLSAL